MNQKLILNVHENNVECQICLYSLTEIARIISRKTLYS